MGNLANSVRSAVEDHPKAPAVVTGEETDDYGDLWVGAGRFAGGLREYGVDGGDRVLIAARNGPAFVTALLGTLRNGSVAVPIPADFDIERVASIVEACDPSVAVVPSEAVTALLAKVEGFDAVVTVGEGQFGVDFETFTDTDGLHDYWETIARDDDDHALVTFAGTNAIEEGGATYTHGALAANVEMVRNVLPGGLDPTDAQLGVMPAFHPFSLVPVLLSTLVSGGAYHPLPTPSIPETIERLGSGEITVFQAARPMLAELVDSGSLADADLSGVSLVGSIGGPLPPGAAEAADEGGCENVVQLFGQPASGPVFLAESEHAGGNRLGRPVGDAAVRVVDGLGVERQPVEPGGTPDADNVGELLVASPALPVGFSGNDERNGRDSSPVDGDRWYHTGVDAYRDESGAVFVPR